MPRQDVTDSSFLMTSCLTYVVTMTSPPSSSQHGMEWCPGLAIPEQEHGYEQGVVRVNVEVRTFSVGVRVYE